MDTELVPALRVRNSVATILGPNIQNFHAAVSLGLDQN